jgi:thiopeptide-type bacteriocin biosynthesis protein
MQFLDTVIIRSPLLPQKSSYSSEEVFTYYQNPAIREALFLASPNLHNELEKYEQDPDKYEDEERLLFSLLKYLLRMSNRSTPFGMMAGLGLGQWGKESMVIRSEAKNRATGLDMNFLGGLISKLQKIPEIKAQLRYTLNNSAYCMEGEVRFVEFFYQDNTRIHQISSAELNEYLAPFLELPDEGQSIEQLVALLDFPEISQEEKRGFIEQLIDAQLLVSNLLPNITGESFFTKIRNSLRSMTGERPARIVQTLDAIQEKLEALDSQYLNSPEQYAPIIKLIESLEVPFNPKYLFQTNLFYEFETAHLKKKISYQLGRATKVLNKLTPPPRRPYLKEFKERFVNRYQDQEVPLMEALDPDKGVGYKGSHTMLDLPFLDGVILSRPENQNTLPLNSLTALKLKLINDALLNNRTVVDLADHELLLDRISTDGNRLCESFYYALRIFPQQDKDPHVLIDAVGGPSATNIINRFASDHVGLESFIQDVFKTEEEIWEERGCMLAEIVHLPEARTGNVLHRKVQRKYEIPYLAKVDPEKQIKVDDLLVSVIDDDVVLRSRAHDRRVIPKLSNAHNYIFNSLPVYNFLCDLQCGDNNDSFYFSWDDLEHYFTFLPRVVYQNIVLFRAQWRFPRIEMEKVYKMNTEDFSAWRTKHGIPNVVTIGEADNELVIDFNNPLSRKLFVNETKRFGSVLIREELYDAEESLVRDEQNQAYASEFFTFAMDKSAVEHLRSYGAPQQDERVQRTFFPGSEWLYLELYSGAKVADEILADLHELLTHPAMQKLVDQYFFIRYNVPEQHIRLRLQISKPEGREQCLDILHREVFEKYASQKKLYNVRVASYERELERYGPANIEDVERIFCADSATAMSFFSILNLDNAEIYKWKYAIIAIDSLLSDFGFELKEKAGVMETLESLFGSEFRDDKTTKKALSAKYRNYKQTVEDVFDEQSELYGEIGDIFSMMEHRSSIHEEAVASIRSRYEEDDLFYRDVINSIIHMICNRVFTLFPRHHEFLCYYFLARYYKTSLYKRKPTVHTVS